MNTALDLDRENRIHVYNVRFDSSKKKYIVTCKDPSDNSYFDVDRDEWITYGDWQQRKSLANYY